jgi:hypothetical protein
MDRKGFLFRQPRRIRVTHSCSSSFSRRIPIKAAAGKALQRNRTKAVGEIPLMPLR